MSWSVGGDLHALELLAILPGTTFRTTALNIASDCSLPLTGPSQAPVQQIAQRPLRSAVYAVACARNSQGLAKSVNRPVLLPLLPLGGRMADTALVVKMAATGLHEDAFHYVAWR